MAQYIVRQDKGGRNERWLLDIGEALLTLTAPNGYVMLQWSPADVAQGVQFPSFSKSIKSVGFNVAGGGMYQFSLDAASLKQLRDFANRGIAAGGSGAIGAVLRNAVLTCLGGLALFGFGVVSLYLTITELAGNTPKSNRSVHPTGVVTTLLGFAILCRGIYGLYQYAQLKKVQSTPTTQASKTSGPPPLPKR